MGEFWYGKSPDSAVRSHGRFYPSCTSKCGPLLRFMLKGQNLTSGLCMDRIREAEKPIIVFEDDAILVVEKPSGIPSVPGLDCRTSLLELLSATSSEHQHHTVMSSERCSPVMSSERSESRHLHPVHRLDMDTSGLLLIAKDEETHALLQEQFEKRQVKKRYIALLNGLVTSWNESDIIRLPLRPDYDNRPLQMVDFEWGKPAVTRYEVLDVLASEAKTRIAYWPETGRTHQLRVHSAHPDGMDCPIVGDPLYGQPAERLYLHAEQLTFRHPASGKMMKICCEPDF